MNSKWDTEFVPWEPKWRFQLSKRFMNHTVLFSDKIANIGLGRKSAARDDLLVDEDANAFSITDARRLSRYHFEDVLRVQLDHPLVLYFCLNTKRSNVVKSLQMKPFDGKLRDAGKCWDMSILDTIQGNNISCGSP